MILIREFASADVSSLLRIEHEAHPGGHWKAEDYTRLSRGRGGIVLVAEMAESEAVAGFVAARAMGSDAEMLNLAVAAEHRRRGVGRKLLEELHRRLSMGGTERVYLEVRPSNLPAQQLYRSFGYVECGRRRNYYASNGEDALVFEIRLASGGTPAADPAPAAETSDPYSSS